MTTVENTDLVPMNVQIPKELHKALKYRALDRDMPLRAIVREALETYLNRVKADA